MYLWEQIVKSKELIVSALDLLSFLFVTPELIKFVRPAAGNFISLIILGIPTAILLLGVYYGFTLVNDLMFDHWHLWSWIATGVSLIFCLFFLWISTRFVTFIESIKGFKNFIYRQQTTGPEAGRLFLIGVVLFLCSRILMFAVAATEMFRG